MDNFEFQTIGTEDKPFLGYVSSKDKTNTSPLTLIRGSKNTYKKKTGTIASRDGLKKLSPNDTTVAGITAEYTWNFLSNREYLMRVQGETSAENDGKLQFQYNDVVYDLLTGLSNTRFVFDKIYVSADARERLVFVNGDGTIKAWTGGFTQADFGTTLGISGITNIAGNGDILSMSSTSANIVADSNELTATIADVTRNQIAIVFKGQPSNGETITFGSTQGSFVATFVNVIGATPGNVLIGATTADTLNNLLGLLQNPTTTSATQVAYTSAPNYVQLQGMDFLQSSVIVKADTSTTWFQDGYTENGSVLIGGVEYAYTSDANMFILFGVTPDPSAIVPGLALQAVASFGAPITADFLRVINNQLYLGSYSNNLVPFSSDTNYGDFTVGGTPQMGDPGLLILNGYVNNIAVRKGHAIISAGSNLWYDVSFSEITVGSVLQRQTIVEEQVVAGENAAYAHEFTDNVGDDLVFLSKEQQLCIYGGFRELTQNKYPSLSEAVENELKEEDFTGGALVAIGEYIYITAPINGRDWMYQSREALNNDTNVVSERLWHPPQIRNISRFTFALGVVAGYSNANPMLYQVWDTGQWSDDTATDEQVAYDCVARFAYKNSGKRYTKVQFDKVYHEGYIAEGVTLQGKAYMDYQGSSSTQAYTVNSIEYEAIYYTGSGVAPSLGDSSLGANPLAAGLIPDTNDQESLPKFRVIKPINPVDCFEYSLEVSSTELDSRWELLSIGPNARPATVSPTELIVAG